MPEFRAEVGRGCGKPGSAFVIPFSTQTTANVCSPGFMSGVPTYLCRCRTARYQASLRIIPVKSAPKTSLDQRLRRASSRSKFVCLCLIFCPPPQLKRFLFANYSLQMRKITHYKGVAGKFSHYKEVADKLFIAGGLWQVSVEKEKPRRLTEAFLSLFLFCWMGETITPV
jgi:hypothetical protein